MKITNNINENNTTDSSLVVVGVGKAFFSRGDDNKFHRPEFVKKTVKYCNLPNMFKMGMTNMADVTAVKNKGSTITLNSKKNLDPDAFIPSKPVVKIDQEAFIPSMPVVEKAVSEKSFYLGDDASLIDSEGYGSMTSLPHDEEDVRRSRLNSETRADVLDNVLDNVQEREAVSVKEREALRVLDSVLDTVDPGTRVTPASPLTRPALHTTVYFRPAIGQKPITAPKPIHLSQKFKKIQGLQKQIIPSTEKETVILRPTRKNIQVEDSFNDTSNNLTFKEKANLLKNVLAAGPSPVKKLRKDDILSTSLPSITISGDEELAQKKAMAAALPAPVFSGTGVPPPPPPPPPAARDVNVIRTWKTVKVDKNDTVGNGGNRIKFKKAVSAPSLQSQSVLAELNKALELRRGISGNDETSC